MESVSLVCFFLDNVAFLSGPSFRSIGTHCTACTGGAYVPAMSDQTVIVQNQGRIFLAGPPLVKAATGEVVDEETSGGGEMHARESGVVDYLVSSDEEGIARGREIVSDLGAPYPRTSPASEVGMPYIH